MRLFLFFSSFLISFFAQCCDCIPSGKIDSSQYNEYAIIFTGKVIKIVNNKDGKFIEMRVGTYFKGNLKSNVVRINTPTTESLCGITPRAGERWLIFSYSYKNYFKTDLCTRTKTMQQKKWDYRKEELLNDLDYLKNRRKNN
jgi:hypothetical protein